MKIRIAICDDEEYFIKKLIIKIREVEILKKYEYKIYTYTSGETMIDIMKNKINFDIIFMDIELKNKILGTDVGLLLKEINPNVLLIYVSCYDSYFSNMVSAEPFAFLQKPIEDYAINTTLNKAIKRLLFLNRDCFYSFKYNGVIQRVSLKSVMYFESQHRIVNIYLNNGSILQFYGKLDDVEKDIEETYPYFVRVSKSYYINYSYITTMNHLSATVNNIEIRIGKKYKEEANKKYINLIANKI